MSLSFEISYSIGIDPEDTDGLEVDALKSLDSFRSIFELSAETIVSNWYCGANPGVTSPSIGFNSRMLHRSPVGSMVWLHPNDLNAVKIPQWVYDELMSLVHSLRSSPEWIVEVPL